MKTNRLLLAHALFFASCTAEVDEPAPKVYRDDVLPVPVEAYEALVEVSSACGGAIDAVRLDDEVVESLASHEAEVLALDFPNGATTVTFNGSPTIYLSSAVTVTASTDGMSYEYRVRDYGYYEEESLVAVRTGDRSAESGTTMYSALDDYYPCGFSRCSFEKGTYSNECGETSWRYQGVKFSWSAGDPAVLDATTYTFCEENECFFVSKDDPLMKKIVEMPEFVRIQSPAGSLIEDLIEK